MQFCYATVVFRVGVLKNVRKITGKHLCQNIFFKKSFRLEICKYIDKETATQVFSGQFCKVFKNTYLIENFQATVQENLFHVSSPVN